MDSKNNIKKYKFVKIEALPESSAKKFKVILENLSTKRTKTIQFGAKGFENYTGGHLDEARKQSYIARHNKREDWTLTGVDTAGFWSYWYLWNFKTFKQALSHILKTYF